MHGKGRDHFRKENWDNRLVIGERGREKKKLTRKGRWSVSELDWEEKEDGVWNKKKNAPLREKLAVAHKKGWKEDD